MSLWSGEGAGTGGGGGGSLLLLGPEDGGVRLIVGLPVMGGEGEGHGMFGLGLGRRGCSALGSGWGACSAMGSAAASASTCSQSHSSNPPPQAPPPPTQFAPAHAPRFQRPQNLHSLKRTLREHARERPQRQGGHLSSKSTTEHPERIRMRNIQPHIVDL